MDDAFEILGLERRPWLEEGEVRRAYQAKARELHPDGPRGDEVAFVKLGEAFGVVGNVGKRLRALADGVTGDDRRPTDPDLFLEVGGILQRSRVLQVRLGEAVGHLDRALLARDLRSALRELDGAAERVAERLGQVRSRVGEVDEQWPEAERAELLELASRWERLSAWKRELGELRVLLGGS